MKPCESKLLLARHDRVGECAAQVHIHGRQAEVADDLPSLAAVHELAQVVGLVELLPGGKERIRGIDDVEVVDEGEIRIGVPRLQVPGGQSRPLHGDVLTGHVHARSARRRGNGRIAGRIHDGFRQNDASALRRRDHDAFDAVTLDEGAATERAIPEVRAGLAQFPPVPFDLHLAVPSLARLALGLSGPPSSSKPWSNSFVKPTRLP